MKSSGGARRLWPARTRPTLTHFIGLSSSSSSSSSWSSSSSLSLCASLSAAAATAAAVPLRRAPVPLLVLLRLKLLADDLAPPPINLLNLIKNSSVSNASPSILSCRALSAPASEVAIRTRESRIASEGRLTL